MATQNIIAIGSDHAGFHYKSAIVDHLEAKGYEVRDFGTDSVESTDYPDYVHPLAQLVDSGAIKLGILVCGSGNGVCMTANKYPNVRAAMAWQNELAQLARTHNDANVLCLPERFISEADAIQFVDTFIGTDFEGGRHARRVNKIARAHS